MNSITIFKLAGFLSLLHLLQSLAVAQVHTNNLIDLELEKKRADIKKLILVTGTENLLKQTISDIVPQLRQAMPQVPEESWLEAEKPESINAMMEIYVSIYEKHFTHDEIIGMLAFYDTPLGRKVVSKMPVIMKESAEAGTRWGVELVSRAQRGLLDIRHSEVATRATELPPGQKTLPVQQPGPDSKRQEMRADDPRIGRQLLINFGLNPEEWEIKPVNGSYDGTIPTRKRAVVTSPPVPPSDVQYVVRYRNANGQIATYYSKEEPKPFGSGFKFRVYPTDAEITLSGNVEIIKISGRAPKSK